MAKAGDDYWKSFLPSAATVANDDDEEKFIVEDEEYEGSEGMEDEAEEQDEQEEYENMEGEPEEGEEYEPPIKKGKYRSQKGKAKVIPNTIIKSTRGGFLVYDSRCYEYRLSNAKRDRSQIDTNRVIPLRCNVRTCNSKARLHQGSIVEGSTSDHSHPPKLSRCKAEPIRIELTAILPRGPPVNFDFSARGGVLIEVDEYKFRLTYAKRDQDLLHTESILPIRCAVRACPAVARIQNGYFLDDENQTSHIHPPECERKRQRRIVLAKAQEQLGLPIEDASLLSIANLVKTLKTEHPSLDKIRGCIVKDEECDTSTDGSESPNNAREAASPAMDTTIDTLNNSNVYCGPPVIGNLVKSIRGSFLVYDDDDFEYRLANSKRDQPLILTDTIIPLRCNVKSCTSKAKLQHGLVLADTQTAHSHEAEPGMREKRVSNFSRFQQEQLKGVAKMVLRNYIDNMEAKQEEGETKPLEDSYSYLLPSTSHESKPLRATATVTIETKDLILPKSETPDSIQDESGEIEEHHYGQDGTRIPTTVTKSNRGGYLFYDDEGYEYRLSNAKRDQPLVETVSESIIPVRCNMRSCHSNARVQNNGIIYGSITPHNHEPEWGKKEKRLTIHAIREDRKKGVSIRKSIDNLSADERLLLPSFASLSRQIQRSIKVEAEVFSEWPYRGWQKQFPGMQTFDNFSDSFVPEDHHLFIVAHPMGLSRLSSNDEWFIDTQSFESYKPNGIDAMGCIGTMVNGVIVPGVWFGYVGDSAPEKYKCVFMWLRSKLTGSPPKVLVCDFDTDISRAVSGEFSGVRIVRCNLASHILQEIDSHGLSTEVETDAQLVNLLRSLVSLQYVSPSSAKPLFSALLVEVRKKAAVLLPLFNEFSAEYIGKKVNSEWQDATFAPMEWCVEDRYLHGLPVEYNSAFILEIMKEGLEPNTSLGDLAQWIAKEERRWSQHKIKQKKPTEDARKLVKTLKCGYDVGEELSFLLQLSDFVNFEANDEFNEEEHDS